MRFIDYAGCWLDDCFCDVVDLGVFVWYVVCLIVACLLICVCG